MKKTIVCLIGPTAVGKTEVSLQLAKKIGAEIISCDSMQIYQGINIASAKPTRAQRKQVPHHFLDIIKPSQQYNAARFSKSARKIINDIHKRGKLPLIVAGTGLYLRALLDGLFQGPGQSVTLRKKLYTEARRFGVMRLYNKLKRVDPQAASTIHAHDLRRIIRALEVYQKTGRPISQLRKETSGIRGEYVVRIFGLRRKRDQLYARIDRRVEAMLRRGLTAEIKGLTKRRLSKTARSLLGYKEIKGYLLGEYSRDEAQELLKRNTRHYAKRQLSWFKREKGARWIELMPKDTPAYAVKQILAYFKPANRLTKKCGKQKEIKKKKPF